MSDINWSSLPFGYFKTDCNVRCYYRDGKWGELEFSQSEEITMHMAATCLHYGQEGFEGMKAFRGVDDKIRLFRPYENAKRLRRTAEGIMMEPVPEELFVKACMEVVKRNERFVPPAGSGASLYIRPLLIGTGPQVGVRPAEEYLFMIFVGTVGPNFKEVCKPVKFQLVDDFDRAAPLGTGTYKVGGNYAASLFSGQRAAQEGFSNCIYLDAIHKKYIDEAGAANFFGIKNNTYCTPKSPSILQSITNMSLRQLAKDIGMSVEERPIPVEELSTFEEVAACGTAAVISPICQIQERSTGKVYDYGTEAGPVCTKLYDMLTGIQDGRHPDTHNWNEIVD